MEIKKEYENSPIICASNYVEQVDLIYKDWREMVDLPVALEHIQDELDEGQPTQPMLGNLRVTLGGAPYLAATVSELLSTGQISYPERWKKKDAVIRKVLIVAALMDHGDWEGIDYDESGGGKVRKSEETMALEDFIEELTATVNPSSGEKK